MFKGKIFIYLWLFVTMILLTIMISDFNDFLFAILLWLVTTLFLFSLYSDSQNESSSKSPVTNSSEPLKQDKLNQEQIISLEQLQKENSQEIENLKQQCQQLKQELKQQTQLVKQDVQQEIIEVLNSLLITYPTVRKKVELEPELPAKNLINLFTCVENLVHHCNLETIGEPWQKVSFDPQLHQADQDDLKSGEDVYIRFVGYRQGASILYPAKVSKTLPKAIAQNTKH